MMSTEDIAREKSQKRMAKQAAATAREAWNFDFFGVLAGQILKLILFIFVAATFIAMGLYTSKVRAEQDQIVMVQRNWATNQLMTEVCRYHADPDGDHKPGVARIAIGVGDRECRRAEVILSESYVMQITRHMLVAYSICEPGECWNSFSQFFTIGWFTSYVLAPLGMIFGRRFFARLWSFA